MYVTNKNNLNLILILQNQATFMRIVGFPGVVGDIDGTPVQITAPTVDVETYR